MSSVSTSPLPQTLVGTQSILLSLITLHQLQLTYQYKTDHFLTTASAHKTQYTYHPCNVTSASAISTTLSTALKTARHPLRGLVTTAGTSGEADAVDYPPEDFRRLLDLNVTGTFLVAQAAARIMREQKVKGSMVLVASMSGHGANKVLSPFPRHQNQSQK